jgi:hypothetical protein
MPKVKTTAPRPSREKGQRSLDLPEFLLRNIPAWRTRKLTDGTTWRNIVDSQPVAGLCREALISNYISLDWKIEPKDSEQRDELKSEIEYYTEFFTNTGDYEYETVVEWIGKDMLDIPFGAAAEVGREGDRPDGKVMWLELIDGSTLFPYPSKDWPVYQRIPYLPSKVVFFPRHSINRVYYSPNTAILDEGWGIPPPEKVYLALELLVRGDRYYANLLLDTPEAGILDLGDMSKESAEEWVKAFRNMMGGIDPMKIPVLYEHNNSINFLPFGKPPTDLMFDRVTAKYASIVASGYGLALSDIGIQTTTSGGDTLAGSIRDERKTRRTGFARFKKKMISFFNFMLPSDLEYKIIDTDDELSVAMSRSRLANATAAAQYIDKRIFTPQEMRRQAIADGLITISVPEDIPEDEFPDDPMESDSQERTNMLGKPVAPSQGGHGEVVDRSDAFSDEVGEIIDPSDAAIRKMIRSVVQPLSIQTQKILEDMNDAELAAWDDWFNEVLWGDDMEGLPELTMITLSESRDRLALVLKDERWWNVTATADEVYDDFSDIIEEAVKKRSSEVGESIENIEYEEKLKARISEILNHAEEEIERGIINSVISGTKKTLINREATAKSLDEQEILHDNKTVDYVRQEISSLGTKVIENFASSLSQAINDILEEI